MNRIELPDDVREFIIGVQADKKIEKRSGFFSLTQTIVYCLRELMTAKGFRPKIEPEEKHD